MNDNLTTRSRLYAISTLANDAAESLLLGGANLSTLAKTIIDCPPLLQEIKAGLVGENLPDMNPHRQVEELSAMSNIWELDLEGLLTHADKLASCVSTIRRLIVENLDASLPADSRLSECFDALHTITALFPKRQPSVECKITCDTSVALDGLQDEVGTLVHEAIRAGLAGDPNESVLRSAPGYEQLVDVFRAAHDQAAYGKGKERHGHSGVPFHEQRMQVASDAVGSPDGMVYQVIKKTTEGLEFSNPDKREHELLGALNYLAGVIIWLRRHETSNQGEV